MYGDHVAGFYHTSQWYQSSYTFGIPVDTSEAFVTITGIIPSSAAEYLSLDGVTIPAAQYDPVGTSGYGMATVSITGVGHHVITLQTLPSPSA